MQSALDGVRRPEAAPARGRAVVGREDAVLDGNEQHLDHAAEREEHDERGGVVPQDPEQGQEEEQVRGDRQRAEGTPEEPPDRVGRVPEHGQGLGQRRHQEQDEDVPAARRHRAAEELRVEQEDAGDDARPDHGPSVMPGGVGVEEGRSPGASGPHGVSAPIPYSGHPSTPSSGADAPTAR